MPTSDNDEFDKLIKDAVEHYPATGANANWEQMQALLDKHLPVTKNSNRKGLLLLILLFIFLLVGGTYLYFNKATDHSSPLAKAPTVSNTIAIKEPSRQSRPDSSFTGDTKDVASKTNQSPLSLNKEKTEKNKETVSNSNAKPLNKIKGRLRAKTSQGEVSEINLRAANEDVATNPGKNGSLEALNDPSIDITPQKNIASPNKNLQKETTPTEVIIEPNRTIADTTKTAMRNKITPAAKRKHLPEFTLVYAPELTSIGFSYIDKPGSNYGLLVGYPISKNLTLQTGFLKSRKNYIANGNDFDLGYPQTASHKLTKVDGYCMMYEIPLNIRSQITNRKKLNVFYTAGISSYFMTSEFYTYHYSTSTGDYSKSVSFNSQKNYWFSLATLGLGIEKEISNALNIAAMPYTKIPFKGMGTGKLKLLSTGINFLLTYKPSFNKK